MTHIYFQIVTQGYVQLAIVHSLIVKSGLPVECGQLSYIARKRAVKKGRIIAVCIYGQLIRISHLSELTSFVHKEQAFHKLLDLYLSLSYKTRGFYNLVEFV